MATVLKVSDPNKHYPCTVIHMHCTYIRQRNILKPLIFKILLFRGTVQNCITCQTLYMFCTGHWGIPSPDGIPYGFADFFFFFFPPHFRWLFVVKKTTDWAEILHNHTYGYASGQGKKYFRCAHFPLSYVSKITQKNFRNS